MSKKLLAAALVVLSCSQASVAETTLGDGQKCGPMSGAWFGLGLGYAGGFVSPKGDIPTNYFDPVITVKPLTNGVRYFDTSNASSAKSAISAFLAKLQAGFDCKLRNTCVMMGVYAGASINAGKTQIAIPLYIGDKDGAIGAIEKTPNFKLAYRGSFEAAARLGVIFGSVFPYLKAGWSIHNFRFSGTPFPSVSKWHNAFLFGLGMEMNLTRSMLVGLDLDFHLAQRKSYNITYTNLTARSVANGGPTLPGAIGFAPRLITQALVTFKYKIPTCQ